MSEPPTEPSRTTTLWSWLWRPVLVLLVAGALGWWMLSQPGRTPTEHPRPEPDSPAAAAPPEERAWVPRPRTRPAPGCAPEAERRCVDGDVWWVDGCGVAYEVAEDCEGQPCREGECEPPPPADCGGEPILGRCDGDVARGCEGGYPFAVDCGALGRRCVQTEEGPVCRPAEDACDPTLEPPRCDGDTLLVCHDGQRMRTDCRAHGGVCGRPAGRSAVACVQHSIPGCDDACGCASTERGEEICNGLDDDDDGFIDEALECPPVDIVVFVVVDEDGHASYGPEDVEAELLELGRAFTREDGYGLEFHVVDVVRLAAPEWLELAQEELWDVTRAVEGARDEFFVPVVLTERLVVDGVPRPGLSTVPNGECGGQRRVPGPQPPLGLVALAVHHWPTTLSHELGHFLGLCHTHGDHPAPIVSLSESDEPCAEACTIDGDGVCDTPEDPGPSTCAVDLQCQAACTDGGPPDPTNIMGYYPQCRRGFTEQQALLMRQTVARRRAWHRCIVGDGCPCEMVGSTCPEGMSCRRYVGDDGAPMQRCALDGPAVPGGVCTGSQECSLGSVCIGQPDAESRCVRPCDTRTPACRCVEVGGVSHSICIDDLRRDDG